MGREHELRTVTVYLAILKHVHQCSRQQRMQAVVQFVHKHGVSEGERFHPGTYEREETLGAI